MILKTMAIASLESKCNYPTISFDSYNRQTYQCLWNHVTINQHVDWGHGTNVVVVNSQSVSSKKFSLLGNWMLTTTTFISWPRSTCQHMNQSCVDRTKRSKWGFGTNLPGHETYISSCKGNFDNEDKHVFELMNITHQLQANSEYITMITLSPHSPLVIYHSADTPQRQLTSNMHETCMYFSGQIQL